MTLEEADAAIDRLVLDLARATGRPEALVRLGYGLERATSDVTEASGRGGATPRGGGLAA
ncbi:hypothetical protein [Actinotalea solisilvae]|uniref:hypothetical protein n=1 Tax=Actinotalea solisilvae TaxID=2072922 RepID=UPI0018F1CA68|nr:hypothetical protein [Actinotalea solisilvae]